MYAAPANHLDFYFDPPLEISRPLLAEKKPTCVCERYSNTLTSYEDQKHKDNLCSQAASI